MDKSFPTALTFGCVSALLAGFLPAGHAQVGNLDSAPSNAFDTEREEALAKYLELGPISVRPHFHATAYYDDNLAITPHDVQRDMVLRFSPGVLFGVGEFRGDKGNYLTLDYTGTGSIYTTHSDYNALDHLVGFNAGWKLAKLTLGVAQSYEIASGKQVEASGFVEQENYTTLLTSRFDLSDKTFFEVNGRQFIICSERIGLGAEPDFMLNAINEWAVEGWGNYKPTDKLTVGVGGDFGWRDIRAFENGGVPPEDTPNQTFQRILARGAYEVSEKLDLRGSIGAQFSQFQDGDDKGPIFIFNVGGTWEPLEQTSLSLDAYRRDNPSYTESARNYTVTGIRANLQKTFLEKYTASIAGGYENSDYSKSSATPGLSDRTDNYCWVRPNFEYRLDDRWALGAFYQFRTKSSNQPDDAFDYSNNQVGLYTHFRF
jgi:hypothetical protein